MPNPATKSASALKALSPAQFENLVFDLLVVRGLRNAAWRTPGADGGRDVEGDVFLTDPSGEIRVERWYADAKRYQNTLDWPSVFAKLAYASNARADTLLIATTGLLSPNCRSEVSRHNSNRLGPRIRYWDLPRLVALLDGDQAVADKHGIRDSSGVSGASLLPLAELLAKSVAGLHAAFETGATRGSNPELAAALAELLVVRTRDLRTLGRASFAQFRPERDLYEWSRSDKAVSFDGFDAHGTRALLAMSRFLWDCNDVKVAASAGDLTLKPESGTRSQAGESFLRDLKLVSFWGNVDFVLEQDFLTISAREGV